MANMVVRLLKLGNMVARLPMWGGTGCRRPSTSNHLEVFTSMLNNLRCGTTNNSLDCSRVRRKRRRRRKKRRKRGEMEVFLSTQITEPCEGMYTVIAALPMLFFLLRNLAFKIQTSK